MRIPQRLVQRVCVWYSMQLGDPATKTFSDMQRIFGNTVYSRTSVFRWHKDFRDGRTKLGDMFRKGGPKLARNATMISSCKRKVLRNKCTGIHKLARSLSISYGSVHTILHKDLKMRKRAAKLVPHNLTPAQARSCLDFCRNFVAEVDRDASFLNWIVTCDESYFHMYDHRSNFESKEWLTRDENHPQVFRRPRSTPKVMFVPFFDRRGLVYSEFVDVGTVSGCVFNGILNRMHARILPRRGLIVWRHRNNYKLHMDNASAHTCDLVQGSLTNLNFPTLKHPAYSPDLSPCDFFLFPLIKRKMRGIQFADLNEVKEAVQDHVADITLAQWQACFDDWVARCRKCIQFRGYYFEGMKHLP